MENLLEIQMQSSSPSQMICCTGERSKFYETKPYTYFEFLLFLLSQLCNGLLMNVSSWEFVQCWQLREPFITLFIVSPFSMYRSSGAMSFPGATLNQNVQRNSTVRGVVTRNKTIYTEAQQQNNSFESFYYVAKMNICTTSSVTGNYIKGIRIRFAIFKCMLK